MKVLKAHARAGSARVHGGRLRSHGPAAALRGILSIAAVLVPSPTVRLTARLGARVVHLVSRRRRELCFANYLIVLCGHFNLGLSLT